MHLVTFHQLQTNFHLSGQFDLNLQCHTDINYVDLNHYFSQIFGVGVFSFVFIVFQLCLRHHCHDSLVEMLIFLHIPSHESALSFLDHRFYMGVIQGLSLG